MILFGGLEKLQLYSVKKEEKGLLGMRNKPFSCIEKSGKPSHAIFYFPHV